MDVSIFHIVCYALGSITGWIIGLMIYNYFTKGGEE